MAAMAESADQSRIAAAGDAAEVAGLLARFNEEFDEFTPGADVLAPRVVDHIERGLSVFLLAGPTDVGVAQLRFREYLHTGTPVCYLEELYVVSEQRREGHGRQMMETAFEVARERRATSMELGTAVSDRAARALYERLGFANLEQAGDPETSMLFYEREL